ncbi:MAG: suppressor of fused domain protein [Kofleriaceae bacterium]|nr:suppressor of fused domain protein [Kofleriaceae bacterium]MCL4223655.1 suppressor of fused domain protein [Myxococcales bacterium]
MSKHEVSRGGSEILRHQTSDDAAAPGVAPTDVAAADAVAALVERHCGRAETVFHELVSAFVHIDVHVVPPDPAAGDDAAWTLFTTGMSDLPMTLPDDIPAPRFAELMLRLPASWTLAGEAASEERWYWPVRWLKLLARLPHEYRTWLGDGHTIPNGDPPRPFHDGCPFVGVVIGLPTSLPDDDEVARTADKDIHLYTPYPLHADELGLKLEQGWSVLAERLGAADVTDLIDVTRPSVAGRGRRRR